LTKEPKQVAQLLQRERSAGWVSFGQKWKTGKGNVRGRRRLTLKQLVWLWRYRAGWFTVDLLPPTETLSVPPG